MNNRIEVGNNETVHIINIHQSLTYDGLLEGMPTKRLNDRILEGTQAYAKKLFHCNAVFLIEPEQKPIEYEGRYPFGEPAGMPLVTCIVKLKSYGTYRDKTKDYSELVVIWLQEEFLFPIDPEILEKIKQIPFGELCQEEAY